LRTVSRSRSVSFSIREGGPPIDCWFSVKSRDEPDFALVAAAEGGLPPTGFVACSNIAGLQII
jgi:hypothetical protein